MNPSMRRAQRHQKNTKKQAEELALKKSNSESSTESTPVRKRTKAKNPAALVNKSNRPKTKKTGKTPPKTGQTSNEIREDKKRRLKERQQKRKERDRSRSASRSRSNHASHDSEEHSEVVVKVKSKSKKTPERFPDYHYVKKTKTAKQLMAEKKKNATAKNQISPEEYERIKQARLKADKEAMKTKKVVKADTEIKKKVVRDKHTGKKKYKYIQQDPKSFEEYWEDKDYRPETHEIKDLDAIDARKRIDSVMKRTGKKYGPNERVKIGDDVKEVFTLEDLDPNKEESGNNIPIVDVDSIDTMINSTVLKSSRRDVLLVGLSESTKDAIIDEIMDSKLGRGDKVFDTTVIDDEDEKPKGCICIYSDTVPIKPPENDSAVEESSEDSFDAQHKERIRKVREKQAHDKSKKREPRRNKKKVVKAVAEDKYEEIPYDLRKDYPTARFIYLTKVSAIERVDLQKLWKNTASFIEFKRFKKKFSELNRYECLVIDQLNKKRLYRIEFE
jgi:hypothetical protein